MDDEIHDIQPGDYVRCHFGVCRVLRIWRDRYPWCYEVLDRSGQTRHIEPWQIYHVQIRRKTP